MFYQKNQCNMKMKFLLLIFAFTISSFGQSIFTNPITAADPSLSNPFIAGQTVDANMTVSGIGRGAGIAASSASNRFSASGWSTAAIDLTDYFEFTLNPNVGYKIDLVSFVYTGQFSSGTPSFAFRSSADGYSSNIGAPTGTGTTISLSAAAYQNLIAPITFRIYAFGMAAAGTTFSINDFTFNGAVTTTGPYSVMSGDWNLAATWSTNPVIPVSTDNVTITAGHTVYTSIALTRTGTTTVNGTFQINNSGYASGTNFNYNATTGSLNFNTTTNYGIAAADVYWPTTNSPVNVSVLQGGIVLAAGANRTVSGIFSTASSGATSGVQFPTATLTLNGTCRIDNGGFFNNSPVFGASSTLVYNAGVAYGRGFEWSALGVGTIGSTIGYPNNVQLSGNTNLNYTNGTPLAKAMNGNLTVDAGSTFSMDYGSVTASGFLTVAGNVTVAGTLRLGFAAGDDLKTAGNISFFTGTGTLVGNSRAIFFTKAGIQTVSSTLALTIPYVVLTSGSTTVQLLSSLIVSAPATGNAITFAGAGDTFEIGANTLTIGTAALANTISGAGTFKGITTSNLFLLGTGSIGTLNFTTGFQNLATFLVNRTAASTACVLGTPVTVNTNLTLTNGIIDLAATTMTLASTCSNVFTDSANSFVISDVTAGGNLRKNVTATGTVYRFPIGDKTGTVEWSPATVNFTAGTFAAAYIGVQVQDFALATGKHPSLDATTHYISRFWSVNSSGTITAPTYTFASVYVDADINGTEASSFSNQWNGTVWSNGGANVAPGPNSLTVGTITTLPVINDFTAGLRNPEINVLQGATTILSGAAAVNFGTIGTGSTSGITFTIQNLGQQSLTLNPLYTLTGNPPYTVSASYSSPVSGPSGTTTFTILFSPTVVGTFTGSISIINNDPSGSESPYVINFTGVGAIPSPEINIQGFGSTINPGNIPIGFDNTLFAGQNVSTTSAAKSYDIQSLGNIPLLLTGGSPYVTLGGTNPGDFAVTIAPLQSIPQSTSSAFSITFTPTAGGSRTATVTVGSNDVSEPTYTFNIEGTGLAPEIEVFGNGISIVNGSSPASTSNNTDFGNAHITSGTVVRTFTVFNTGALNLTLSAATITGANAADFSITTNVSSPLSANTSTTLVITFDPSTIGVKNALVTIPSNDANENPYTFAILGNGINYIECGLNILETIAIQDFEVALPPLNMGYAVTQEVGAGVAAAAAGTAYGSSRLVVSNKFIGGRSFQTAGHLALSGTVKTTTIDFATVDASAYQEVGLNLKIGGYSTTTVQGLDSNSSDNIKIYISTNNGTTWSQEMNVAGSSDAIWNISSSTGSATLNFDNNNITSVFSAGAGSVNTGPRDITINNIPNSSQLKIRIIISLDRLDELWAIDDVKFQGKKPAIATWTSAAGGSWSPSAPTPTVKAVIDYPYNTGINGFIETCSCKINGGNTLTVASSGYLEIQNDLINDGILNIQNSGSLVQVNDSGVNSGSGTTTMNRDVSIRKQDYVYWSSPFANFPVTSISPTTLAGHIWKWIPTQSGGIFGTWVNTTENMVRGKGYIVRGPSAFTTTAATFTAPFTGTVPFTGLFTTPIERGNYTGLAGYPNPNPLITTLVMRYDDNKNLLGNPYPSSIKSLDFLTYNTNLEGFVSLWTHGSLPATGITNPFYGSFTYNYNSADYIVYNGTGTLSGPGGFNGYIAAGQGFFVTMSDGPADATQTVTFKNSFRNKTYGNSQFYRQNNQNLVETTIEPEKHRIWLDLISSTETVNRTLIGFIEGATNDKDRMYDAYIKINGDQNFYSLIGNDKVMIQGRSLPFDTNDSVHLGMKLVSDTTYKIGISAVDGLFLDNNQSIYLEDTMLNIISDLRQAPYSFTSGIGMFDDRFILRFNNGALGTTNYNNIATNVVVTSNISEIKIKSFNESISSVIVYDVLGREIYQKASINRNEYTLTDIAKNHQALILKIILENGQTVSKKIIF